MIGKCFHTPLKLRPFFTHNISKNRHKNKINPFCKLTKWIMGQNSPFTRRIFKDSFDSCQPARTAQTYVGRNFWQLQSPLFTEKNSIDMKHWSTPYRGKFKYDAYSVKAGFIMDDFNIFSKFFRTFWAVYGHKSVRDFHEVYATHIRFYVIVHHDSYVGKKL